MNDPIQSSIDTQAAIRRTQQLSELVDHTIGRMTSAVNDANAILRNVEKAEELGVDANAFINMVADAGRVQRQLFEHSFRVPRFELGCLMGMNTPRPPAPVDEPHHTKMVKLVEQLLREAPKMDGAAPDDAGAVECQIMLRNGYRSVGALRKSPSGLLSFMAIGKEQGGDGRVVAVEHFFDYADLECVALPRGAVEHGGRIAIGRG